MATNQIKVHDFAENLKFSNDPSIRKYLDKHYTFFFKHKGKITKTRKLPQLEQYLGDVELSFEDGTKVYIEEKYRRTYYPDILIEITQVLEHGNPGWIGKLRGDYLCYYWHPTKEFYMLPVPLLRLAWDQNKDRWMDEYFQPVSQFQYAESSGTTRSVAVPIFILLEAMMQVSRRP